MGKLDLQYEIANETPADAAPVQANYARIEQHVNSELIERGGTVAMTGQLRLAGNPLNALDATPKQYVDTIIPVGGIIMFSGIVAPTGGVWLMCDGATYQSTAYPELYALIGTRFGGSAGTFNTPQLINRVPIGGGGAIGFGAQGGSADAGDVTPHYHTIDHGHGSVPTGIEDSSHFHAGADHLHGVSIWSSEDGDHYHVVNSPGSQGFVASGTDGGPADVMTGGGGYVLQASTAGAGQHRHTINGATQAADRGLGTSGQSVNHRHGVDIPFFGGTSGWSGSDGTNRNLPPYLGIAFLVRAA